MCDNQGDRTKMVRQATARLNLVLPRDLANELCELVPTRQRSRFIADVLSRELRRLRLLDALECSYGAWADEDHPELATDDDIDRWIAEMRGRPIT